MTPTDRFGTLDTGDPVEVARYEGHFYRAYARLTDNRLVRIIWDWDDGNRRVCTRIPYRDQVVYDWRDAGGQPIAYLAVNVHPDRSFQAAAFGFAPEPERGTGYCEVLTVMRAEHQRRATFVEHRAFVWDFAYRDLAARGFTIAYATCTRRRLRPYVLLGAEIVDATAVDGEERFLLRWPLCDAAADVQRGKHGPLVGVQTGCAT